MANLQIVPAEFKNDDRQLDKRTYLPFVLRSTCPECGGAEETDLRDIYLPYPYVGRSEEVPFCHDFGGDCEHEWCEYVVIGFTLTEAPQ